MNPEVQKRICDALRGGNTRRVAAILGGVSQTTFYNWMDWGDPEHENHKEIYLIFLKAVTRAEAEAEQEHVRNIQLQGIGDWRASVEWLRRRKPKEWGDTSKVDITSDGKQIVTRIEVITNKADDGQDS